MAGSSVYDTRFFFEYFFSEDRATLKALKDDLKTTGGRMVSAVTVYELFKINTEKLGKETAALRCAEVRDDFRVVNLDYDLAIKSAELSHRYRTPLADSVIAATALWAGCPVVTNDPHFKSIARLKTRWPV